MNASPRGGWHDFCIVASQVVGKSDREIGQGTKEELGRTASRQHSMKVMAASGTSGLADEVECRADGASPKSFASRLTDRLDELRSRQALHDELTATRRYAYRLPAPSGRVSPEDLLRSLDAMLTQLAEVVGRLQETVEIQGRLLDRVAGRISPSPSRARVAGRWRAPQPQPFAMPNHEATLPVGVKEGVQASGDQG